MEKGVLNAAMAMVILMGAMIVAGDAAVTCNTVTSSLAPCVPFFAGSAAQPTAACCNGVRSLNSAARTTPDRRTACNCIKSSASSIGLNYSKAAKLPSLCGVNVGVPISPSVNCATIH